MIYREKLSNKPIPLRATFIMSAFKAILALSLYFLFLGGNPDAIVAEGIVLYTGLAYVASFAILVWSILTKNVILYRTMMVIDIAISLPAKAYLGIIFAVVSLGLSVHPKVKHYFDNK